jgi:hypothetical protein
MSRALGTDSRAELEAAALGSVLSRPELAGDLLEGLEVEHFHHAGHRAIFEAILELLGRGEPPGVLEVVNELRARGTLDAAGGPLAVEELLASIAVPGRHHADRLLAEAARAELVERLRAAYEAAGEGQVERALELAREAAERPVPGRSTWDPVDLAEPLEGGADAPEPTLLRRTDGEALIYPTGLTLVFGEPESGKSLLAAWAARDVLLAGGKVLWVEAEPGSDPAWRRLLEMGVDPIRLLEGLRYVVPQEPLTEGAVAKLLRAAEGTALAVVDGVGFFLDLANADPNDNFAVGRVMRHLRRLADGRAGLALDHVAKRVEGRGRWPLGAQVKLANCDAALSVEALQRPAPGRPGALALRIAKDRFGALRRIAHGEALATVAVRPAEGGGLELEVMPPVVESDVSPSAARVLAVLQAAGEPLGYAEIGDALAADGAGPPLKRATIQRACAELAELGLAVEVEAGTGGRGRRAAWVAAETAKPPQTANGRFGGNPQTAKPPPPLKGVAVWAVSAGASGGSDGGSE